MFKNREIQCLIATDVASRGLDIPNVECVINFDCPNAIDDYVHRIGRTGRIGKKGIAYTFVGKDQKRIYPDLAGKLREAGQQVPNWLSNPDRNNHFY